MNRPTQEELMSKLNTRVYDADEGDTVLVIGTRTPASIMSDAAYTEVEFVFDSARRLIHVGVLNTRKDVFVNDVDSARAYRRFESGETIPDVAAEVGISSEDAARICDQYLQNQKATQDAVKGGE